MRSHVEIVGLGQRVNASQLARRDMLRQLAPNICFQERTIGRAINATVLMLVGQVRTILRGFDLYLMAASRRRRWRYVGDLIVIPAKQDCNASVVPVNVRVLVRCAPESLCSGDMLKVHAEAIVPNSVVMEPVDAFNRLFLAIFKQTHLLEKPERKRIKRIYSLLNYALSNGAINYIVVPRADAPVITG